jgi:PKD repeat protein
MVNSNHLEAVMRTTRTTTKSTSIARRWTVALRVLPLAAVAVLAVAQPAAAQPVGGGNGGNGEPVNHAPVARFTISPNPALVTTPLVVAQPRALPNGLGQIKFGSGDTVKFNAGASTDDNGIVKYEWDLDGNGTYEATGKTVSRSYSATGTYNVKLRVVDGDGASGTATHPLKVHRAPKPDLKASAPVLLIGQQLSLDASASTDDNGIAKFEWDLDGDGTYETGPASSKQATSFTTLGSHTVRVRVTDIYGAASTASVTVLVHRAPTASFTDAPSPAVVGETVKFDGSSSSDDDPIVTYEWDLDGDGTYETSSATPTTTHAYTTAGPRTIRLRVTDDHGVQDVVSHALQVDAAPAPDTTAPIVKISPKTVKMSKTGTVTVKVTCPKTERSCTGQLTLRTKGNKAKVVGTKKFNIGGSQTAKLKVKLSKSARKTVTRKHRLSTAATAVAKDAAGNTGTAKATVKIKR